MPVKFGLTSEREYRSYRYRSHDHNPRQLSELSDGDFLFHAILLKQLITVLRQTYHLTDKQRQSFWKRSGKSSKRDTQYLVCKVERQTHTPKNAVQYQVEDNLV